VVGCYTVQLFNETNCAACFHTAQTHRKDAKISKNDHDVFRLCLFLAHSTDTDKTEKPTIFNQTALHGKVVQHSSGNCFSTNKLVFNNTCNSAIPNCLLNIFLHFDSSKNRPNMKIKYRSPMHLDRQNAQLGTKHRVHCRLTMGLMIGTTYLCSNFGLNSSVA